MSDQLEMFPVKRPSVAQVIYRRWWYEYTSVPLLKCHPASAMDRTAKYFDLPYELVSRIVGVQSRWDARKLLRSLGLNPKRNVARNRAVKLRDAARI